MLPPDRPMRSSLLALAAFTFACGPRPSTIPSREASEYTVPTMMETGPSNELWDEALARLRAEDPTFIPIEVEWEARQGARQIELGFIDGETFRERYVDMDSLATLEALENDFSDDAEAADFPALAAALHAAPLRLEDAIEYARARYGSSLQQVEFVMRDGRVVSQVEYDWGEGDRTAYYDPRTGDPLGP